MLHLHGHDLSTEGFATSNIPPMYGKPVDMYISHGCILMLLFPLPIIRLVLRL
jgi:hypothetical protein